MHGLNPPRLLRHPTYFSIQHLKLLIAPIIVEGTNAAVGDAIANSAAYDATHHPPHLTGYFNALDEFINTFHGIGENTGYRGAYNTHRKHCSQNKRIDERIEDMSAILSKGKTPSDDFIAWKKCNRN